MKKEYMALLFVLLAIIVCPFSCVAEGLEKYEYTQDGYQATITQKHWESFDHTHSGFDTPEDLLRYAVNAIERIVKWGGEPERLAAYREAGSDIVLSVQLTTTSGISRVIGTNFGKTKQSAVVALNDSYLTFRMAPIIHELTHVIYPIAYSRTFREGLASYVQNELGEYATIHNVGLNPHEICQNVILPIESNQNLFGLMGSTTAGRKAPDDQRFTFYVTSMSFVTYFIETYGIDTALNVCSNMDEDVYVELTGKTLEEVRADWLADLKQYESSGFTAETIRKAVYDLAIANGVSEKGAMSLSDAVYSQYAE